MRNSAGFLKCNPTPKKLADVSNRSDMCLVAHIHTNRHLEENKDKYWSADFQWVSQFTLKHMNPFGWLITLKDIKLNVQLDRNLAQFESLPTARSQHVLQGNISFSLQLLITNRRLFTFLIFSGCNPLNLSFVFSINNIRFMFKFTLLRLTPQ